MNAPSAVQTWIDMSIFGRFGLRAIAGVWIVAAQGIVVPWSVCHTRPLFDAHFISHPVSGGATLLETADLNADSYPDFILVGTAFQEPARLSVVYGTREGEFETRASRELDVTPQDLELVDVDADGDLDVVLVEFRSSVVHVLLQTAEGVFQPSEALTTVPAPRRIVAGDLNLDGRDDLVVRPSWSTELGIHLALAGGGFAAVEKLPFEAYYARGFEIGDVTGEGHPDLVFAQRSAVEIWPGDGAGGFGTPIHASTPARDLVLADVDVDGHLDILAVTDLTFRVLMARPGGRFEQVAEYESGQFTNDNLSLTSGDLNHDEYPDVLVSNGGMYRMQNFIGNGDGTFEERGSLVAASSEAVVLDVTADGKADVVVPDGRLTVLPGHGDGSFVRRRQFALGDPYTSNFGHAIGDLNGDGALDVVAANSWNGVNVLLGQGDGDLSWGPSPDVASSGNNVELADLDSDGALDLIVAGTRYPEGFVSVLLGRGDASFASAIETPIRSPTRIRMADLNEDGLLDVIVTVVGEFEGSGGMTVLLGDGTGAFASRTDYELGPAQDAVVGDFDGDANKDIVLVTSYGFAHSYWGRGDGGFEAGPVQLLNQSGGWAIEAADFDRDGHLDLVVGTWPYSSTASVDVFRGSGDGSFTLHQALPFPSPHALAVADLDGDGFEDLAVGDYDGRAVSVYLGDGTGAFVELAGYGAAGPANQLRIADMNSDGAPDIVASNRFRYAVSVLLSNPIVTPVLMSNLRASPEDDGIVIEWETNVGLEAKIRSVRVARGPTNQGPFEHVSSSLEPRSHMSFLDESPRPDVPWYRLEAVLSNGSVTWSGPVYALAGTETRSGFNVRASGTGSVRVQYTLAEAGNVDLDVYDVRGRLVQSLVRGVRKPGTHSLDWNWAGRDRNSVARGVYFIRYRAPDVSQSRKIVLLGR